MSTSDEIIALRQDYQARRAQRQAQEREQELKELREDPRYIAAVRQGEQERAEREAEAEGRRRIEAELRESEARSRLQKEKERHRRLWIAAGNPAESFERHWPEIEKRTLMDNYEERARGRYESII
jgi:colicin import membrane protein